MLTNHGDNPLVSVIVAAHNGDAKYLPRAIASLKGQLEKGQLEAIVAFDGEPDEAANGYIVDACSGMPFPVRVVWDKNKTGYYTIPRNHVMPLAHGLYISFLDADNEYGRKHLEGLLKAIREPGEGDEGWPHFAYTRRYYFVDGPDSKTWFWDEGEADWRCTDFTSAQGEEYPMAPNFSHRKYLTGPSPFVPWTKESAEQLIQAPHFNFVDTGDMLVGRGTLYELAQRTGYIWNPTSRRFGDWELVRRMAMCGFRGKAVNQTTNKYHWTGENISTSRSPEDVVVLSESVYERLKAEGKLLVE